MTLCSRCDSGRLAASVFLAFLIFVSLFGVNARGQGTNATLRGIITDPTGAVIPGATVIAHNVATGINTTTHAGSHGDYTVPNLIIGTYEVRVSRAGFATAIRSQVVLTVGGDVVANVQLPVGSVGETVNVGTAGAQVETTDSALGTVIEEKQIRDLPLDDRDLQQLILLSPGVNQVNPTGTLPGTYTHGNASTYSVSGLRPVGMLVLQDGANVSNFYYEGGGNMTANTSFGVDAIAQFQQLTGNYSAEFGGQGSVINEATRGGTNQLHGSLYGYYRTSDVNARNYVFPGQTTAQPPFHKEQFGGALGGPIAKNHTFFFLNYEGLRASIGSTSLGSVPDNNARNGYLPCAYATTYTCNTATGLAFVGVSPTIAPYLQFFPVANGPEVLATTGGATGGAYYTGVGQATQNENYGTARIDHKFRERDSLFGSYTIDNGNTFVPSLPIPGNGSIEYGRNHYLTIQESHTFSPALLNLAAVHFVRLRQDIQPQEYGYQQPLLNFFGGQYAVGALGINGLSGTVTGTINILGTNRFAYTDHIFLTKQRHSVQAGVDVNRLQGNINEPLQAGGYFIFANLVGFLTAKPLSATGAVPGSGSADRGFRETQLIGYAQDAYKVSSRLTLNIGMRYSFVTNPSDKNNLLYALLDPITATSFTHVSNAFAQNPSLRNFDPRVGFVFAPFADQKTSVRGGFGMYHVMIDPRDIIGYAFGYPYVVQSPLAGNNNVPIPFPGINPVSVTTPSTNLTPLYSNKSTPYAMVYNLTLEQEVNKGGIFRVGYVGSNGVHLAQSYDFNVNTAAGYSSDGRLYRPSGNAAVHKVNPNANSLLLETFDGSSHYDSLQASLRESYNSLQFLTSFTWSHCFDYMSQPYSGDSLGESATGIFDPLQKSMNRGRCDYSVPINFNASVVYAVPYHGIRALRGFQVSGLVLSNSGLPYTPFGVGGRSNVTSSAGSPPDRIPGVPLGPRVNKTAAGIYSFNPAAFVSQPFGVVGNAGRDSLIGPMYNDVDVTLAKNTALPFLSEAANLQVRAEAFNALNHPNFGLPGSTVFTGSATAPALNPTAGKITATRGRMRQLQFSAKIQF